MRPTLCFAAGFLLAAAAAAEETWRPLIQGTDLAGWVNVNCAPDTFRVRDGLLVCSGRPTGVLRTERQYENFVLELEWRHLRPRGNAGLFVWSDPLPAPGVPFPRALEVQILDGLNTPNYTSHGDVFAIHGASFRPDRPHPGGWMRCLPREHRCRPAAEWNHYRVTCNNGVIKLEVNGKEVSGGSAARPCQGYICLESEGSEVHFRNLRIRELPTSNPPADDVARQARGFRSLYTGVDLTGWVVSPSSRKAWQVADWILRYDGSDPRPDPLWTQESFGDFELLCDWRLLGKPVETTGPVIAQDGSFRKQPDGTPLRVSFRDAGRGGVYLRGSRETRVDIWCHPIGSGSIPGSADGPERRLVATPTLKADRPPGQWNRFHLTLRGNRITIQLNGRTVIEDQRLAGLPTRGPIGLEQGRDAIELANLLVRPLEARTH